MQGDGHTSAIIPNFCPFTVAFSSSLNIFLKLSYLLNELCSVFKSRRVKGMRLHGQGIVLSHMKRDKPGSKAKGSQRQPEASMVPPPDRKSVV